MRASSAVQAPEVVYQLVITNSDQTALPVIADSLSPLFETTFVSSGDEVLSAIKAIAPQAVVLDLEVVGQDTEEGLLWLGKVREMYSDLVILALSRSNNRSVRIRAGQIGADEFLVAPIDVEELRVVLVRAIDKRADEMENRRLRDEIARKYTFCDIIGGSEPMHRLYDAIRRVAKGNTTVLIRGESGTGKELVARAIVALSPRAEKPFVSLNCAALPEDLIEAELFGHEKGAFTGAVASRPGHIELADGGTLFLDEIATLGLGLQTKLLRVLQDRAVQRIGSKTAKKIDFRLLCATNEDLEQMVETGKFREDLYYRIHVVPVSLPPLRERAGDIPLLIDHFLRVYCTANEIPLKRIDPEALAVLEDNPWPGNVRELENLVQRLVLMTDAPVISLKDLPEKLLIQSTSTHEAMLIPDEGIDFEEELRKIEVAYIQAAIRRAGSKTGGAALLNIPVQKMKYLCRKYKI